VPQIAPQQRRPATAAPLPPPPVQQNVAPIAPGQRSEGPRNLQDFRGQRREIQQGNRTIITEPGRVIVRDGGQTIIRHNEVDRFRYGARDVQVEQQRNSTRTIIMRPDGSQIITLTDPQGRLMRRLRRDPGGREYVIIDNTYRDRDAVGGYYLDLPPPVIRMPRERYIVEAEDADEGMIYDALTAPPVEQLARRYSLDEIRYNSAVRERMPRVDVNTVTFELGSWDVDPDQAQRLQIIADAIRRAIARNPREVFLIEGHTDAVGSDIDNLSLSDRRAENVAQVLSEQFGVPPENLTTQGYGEQYLKIPTQGPERANRRVTVRRITPLLAGGNPPPPPPPR
jgi:outer membrane protein OmpA-like peptidoglycan-associated protein